MLQEINPRFMTYDADMMIRRTAKRISRRNGLGTQTNAIRYSVKFVDEAAPDLIAAAHDWLEVARFLEDYSPEKKEYIEKLRAALRKAEAVTA